MAVTVVRRTGRSAKEAANSSGTNWLSRCPDAASELLDGHFDTYLSYMTPLDKPQTQSLSSPVLSHAQTRSWSSAVSFGGFGSQATMDVVQLCHRHLMRRPIMTLLSTRVILLTALASGNGQDSELTRALMQTIFRRTQWSCGSNQIPSTSPGRIDAQFA